VIQIIVDQFPAAAAAAAAAIAAAATSEVYNALLQAHILVSE
jgi:hypothetical protein